MHARRRTPGRAQDRQRAQDRPLLLSSRSLRRAWLLPWLFALRGCLSAVRFEVLVLQVPIRSREFVPAREGLMKGLSTGRGVSAASAPGGSRTPNLLIRSQMLYPLSYRRRQPMLPRRRCAQERRCRASSWRSRTTTPASRSSDEPPGRRLAPPSAIRSRRSLSWCRPRVARVALRWIVVMMSSSFAVCTHARQHRPTGAGVKGSEVRRPVPYGPASG
jgi:hypothetical protein